MQVPFLDLKAQNRSIWPEIMESLNPVLTDAQFILGPAVERFEKSFAAYIGTNHCVGLNNGTTALHMALIACNVGGPDAEVVALLLQGPEKGKPAKRRKGGYAF